MEETRQGPQLPLLLTEELGGGHDAIAADPLEHVEDVLMSVVGPMTPRPQRVEVLSSLDPVL